MSNKGPRIVVITAPSGSGKTSIARRVLAAFPSMRFSVSATTRPARPGEREGIDYWFMDAEGFERLVAEDAFIEREQVYPGRWYGTLHSEVDRSTTAAPVLLDVDVRGAENVKRVFGADALGIFIRPPSYDILEARLRARGTESAADLEVRLARVRDELTHEDRFDAVVVNDDLDRAVEETIGLVRSFLAGPSV